MPDQDATRAETLQVFFDYGEVKTVSEYVFLPSGRIVVMVEEGGPESFWFESDGTNPKSRLKPVPTRLAAQPPGAGEPKAFPKYHEIRLDDEGGLDDIVLQCDTVHLERMDEGDWWLGVYQGDKRTTFGLSREKSAVVCMLIENDTGAPIVPYRQSVPASGGSTEPPQPPIMKGQVMPSATTREPESGAAAPEGCVSVINAQAPAPCPVREAAENLALALAETSVLKASVLHVAHERNLLAHALKSPCAGRAGAPRKEE